MYINKSICALLCFILLVGEMTSPACRQDIVPFLCLYGFPLCSCVDQQRILPTREECERIRMTTCRVENNLATILGFDDLLPDCNLLPSNNGNKSNELWIAEMSDFCVNSCSSLLQTHVHCSSAAETVSDSGEVLFNQSSVTCSRDFYLENSTCLPICQEWKQNSDAVTASVIGCIMFAGVVGILGCIVVFVGSFIRYNTM